LCRLGLPDVEWQHQIPAVLSSKEKKTENDSVLHRQRIGSSLHTCHSRSAAEQGKASGGSPEHQKAPRKQHTQDADVTRTPFYTLLLPRTSTLRADVATSKRQTTTRACIYDAALHLPMCCSAKTGNARSRSLTRRDVRRDGARGTYDERGDRSKRRYEGAKRDAFDNAKNQQQNPMLC
jgi:hypothetical protein